MQKQENSFSKVLKLLTTYKINASLLLSVLFILISSNLLSQNSSGLNPKKSLGQYILKSWNTEDGLSSESTNDIIQSKDGYIWIGTYTGLHRFDGKNFTIFTPQNSSLPSSNVLRMDIDNRGVLWIGTLHGVCTYQNGIFFTPEALKPVNNYSIETIRATKNNSVWFSTKSNHLFQYNNNELINLTQKFDLTKSTVLTIAEAPDGTIYLGTDDSKLFSYSAGHIKQIHFSEEVNGVYKIVTTKKQVYIGTGKGLYILKNNVLFKEVYFQNTAVNSIIAEPTGILWIGTMRGLFRFQPDIQKTDSLTEANGLPNNIIRDILFDNQGNLWGATYRNGFFFLSDGFLTSFSKNNGLNSDIITGVTEIAENSRLLGNEDGTLNLLKNGQISDYNPEIPLPNARLKHLFTDNQNRIWASTYKGLIMLDGKNSRIYNINNGFPDNYVRQVYQDRKGNIWVGTKNAGLIKFKNLNEWEVIDFDKGLSSNYIMSITENRKNQLIVGTMSGINFLENMEVIKIITIEDGLPSNFSFSTYPTDNYLWIASNDGLIGYSEEKTVIFNAENGLPSNIVYNLAADKKGNLWMPGEKAILMVSIKDLEKAANLHDNTIKVQQFNKSHGMKNNHCLGGVHSYTDKAGNFWIPTQGGIVYINTDHIKDDKLDANLIIENIYADINPISLSDIAVIPSGTSRMRIAFTGIDYKNTDMLQFRYKLKPFDEEWVQASSERNAIYTNLSPGEYEFLLQAGINNRYFKPIKKKILKIKAAWRQTIWAKILFVFLILSIGLIIYLIRIRTLTAQNKKLENMVRTRTAKLEEQKQELSAALTNLSDAQEQVVQSEKMASLGILSAGVAHEMNNPLNFINLGLIGLENYYQKDDIEKPEHLSTLINAIKEGINRATTIVSGLNEFSHQGKSSQEDCRIHFIIENCLIMLQNKIKNKIKLIKKFEDKEPIVTGNSGKLHQAFLNILTNAIQSIENKGAISIKTHSAKKQLILEITDTGSGIKPENITKVTEPFYTTKEPGAGTGLGLSITYKIIKEHAGTLTFSSEKGKGTTATIILPVKN